MFELEKSALRKVFQMPRPTMRETLALAAIYAAQAVLCTIILKLAYDWAGAPGQGWAIISAILVLQPGIEASLAASIARICANLVGATVSILIGHWLGEGMGPLLLAIVVIVFICEILRLDMGLRAACVSAIIVMTFHEGRIFMTSIERSVAVMIGSALAVLLQLVGAHVKAVMFGKPPTAMNHPVSPATGADE